MNPWMVTFQVLNVRFVGGFARAGSVTAEAGRKDAPSDVYLKVENEPNMNFHHFWGRNCYELFASVVWQEYGG